MRQIFIGDIQGCYEEFIALLKKLDYQYGKDELYLVGDVVNRGPKSREVLDYLIAHPEIRVVMGNHEFKFLNACELGSAEKYFSSLYDQLKDNLGTYLSIIRNWPFWIETEEWILVHAGLLPDKNIKETPVQTLCTLRDLPDGRPWYEAYEGAKKVIYGHWAKRGVVNHGQVRGLDSGCVYGRKLTALILPEDEHVAIEANRMYYHPTENRELW